MLPSRHSIVLLFLCIAPPASGAALEHVGPVTFSGAVGPATDLSGVARAGDLLLMVSDEGSSVILLDPVPDAGGYRARDEPIRLGDADVEIDLEGLAVDGRTAYAVGSHSLVRRRLDPSRSTERNRERLLDIAHRPERDRLFRFRLGATGELEGPIDSRSLRPLLDADPLLSRFARIPGKENGVDIEGLAVSGDKLYLGFRSPVLRSGHAPVLVLDFDAPDSYELRLVDLGGRGIRSIERVAGGFLLAAARERDGDVSVYFWNGRDQLPGAKRPSNPALHLGDLPTPSGETAEGFTIVAETEAHYTAVVVYDGSATAATVRIPRR